MCGVCGTCVCVGGEGGGEKYVREVREEVCEICTCVHENQQSHLPEWHFDCENSKKFLPHKNFPLYNK